jgi:hypothetical protein
MKQWKALIVAVSVIFGIVLAGSATAETLSDIVARGELQCGRAVRSGALRIC